MANDAFYFFKSRYYDATIGKFHTPDAVVPGASNPQTLNRYAYALNNPLRLVDPSGHDPMDPAWVKRFEQEHQEHEPTQLDWANYQFSLLAPGSGPHGQWTARDWQYLNNFESTVSRIDGDTSGMQFSLQTSSFSPQLRTPDYYTFTINVSIPNPVTLTLVGVTFQYTQDRNNHRYFSFGGNIGKSPALVSGSLTGGWLLQWQQPTADQLQGFITGPSLNLAGGNIVGAGITWGNVFQYTPSDFALELGSVVPIQFGITGTYTWELS